MKGRSATHRVISTMEAAVKIKCATQVPKSAQHFTARTQSSADIVQVSTASLLFSLNLIVKSVHYMTWCIVLSSAICSQEPDSGPCEGYFRSFYYDVTTQRCQRFVYGGCGGNSNRFSSRKDCRRTCSSVTEHYNPCERFECIHGSRCKVNEITGEPFCEQSCEYDNGGCAEGQICRMTTLICLDPPCADVIECVG